MGMHRNSSNGLMPQEVIDELKHVRGALPFALNRRDFLKGLGSTAAVVGAASLVGCAPATTPAEQDMAQTGEAPDAPAAPAGSGAGMTFTGNEGKTMGEVLGAGWLGEEPEIADDEITEALSCDIVVCGAGHSGVACARKAAEGGANVILIEKQPEDGYTVIGNDIGHLNSKWQTETIGIPSYDPVEFVNDYQIYCAGRANWDLIRKYATRSGEAFDWFIGDTFTDDEKKNITPLNWPLPEGYEEKRGHFGSYVGTANFDTNSTGTAPVPLAEALKRSLKAAQDAGADVRFDTALVRLVHSDDNTEVSGVIAQKGDGSYVRINAPAVVLACGDIGSNAPMFNAICAENYALGEYKDLTSASLSDGTGIAVAMRMGAKVEIGTGGDMGDHMNMMMSVLDMVETPWLNRAGKRFCNEAFGGPMLSGIAAAREPGNLFYSVWDANWQDMLLNQCAGHMTMKHWEPEHLAKIEHGLQAAVGSGPEGFGYSSGPTGIAFQDEEGGENPSSFFYCADTLEELFDYLGMEEGAKANALATIEKYNADCAAGKDTEFGRPANMLFPIKDGPFYGAVFGKGVGGNSMRLVSTSGLLVSGDQQVLGQGFEPIAGLYATGNNSGGRFPLGYNGILNGVSIGMCLALGYVLGEYLAAGDFSNATLGLKSAPPKVGAPGPM